MIINTIVPSWWEAIILTLATYRLTRLIGWDDLPPIARARAWVTGEHWLERQGDTITRVGYTRPTLAHFLGCPFCVGFWLSLLTYMAWLWFPTQTLYAATPLALSAGVGLISKNWDA